MLAEIEGLTTLLFDEIENNGPSSKITEMELRLEELEAELRAYEEEND